MTYAVIVLVYCSKHAMPISVHAEAGVGEYTLPVARFLQYTHINKSCTYSLEGDKNSTTSSYPITCNRNDSRFIHVIKMSTGVTLSRGVLLKG